MLKNLLLLSDGIRNTDLKYKNQVIRKSVDNANYGSNRGICGFSVDEEIRSTGSDSSGPPGVVEPLYKQTSICRNCSSKGFCQEHCNYPFLHTGVFTLSGKRVCTPNIGNGSPS